MEQLLDALTSHLLDVLRQSSFTKALTHAAFRAAAHLNGKAATPFSRVVKDAVRLDREQKAAAAALAAEAARTNANQSSTTTGEAPAVAEATEREQGMQMQDLTE
eukprot:4641410-Prymnesium_polylepis.1